MRGFINASDLLLDMYGIETTVQPNAAQQDLLNAIESASGVMIRTTRDYVAETHLRHGARGAFFQKQPGLPQLNQDCVIMNSNANDIGWYRALFHELAHATGTASRLGRFTLATKVSGVFMHVEEAVADKAAHKLMVHFGLITDDVMLDCLTYFNRHFTKAAIYSSDVSLSEINAAADKAAKLVIQWCENTALNSKQAAA